MELFRDQWEVLEGAERDYRYASCRIPFQFMLKFVIKINALSLVSQLEFFYDSFVRPFELEQTHRLSYFKKDVFLPLMLKQTAFDGYLQSMLASV